MSTVSQPVNIRLFDGTGYENWIFRVERLLERNGCLTVLSTAVPAQSDDDADRKEWAKEDAKAKDLIVQCTLDNVLELIKGKSTAKDMVETLRNTYVHQSMSSRVQLQKQLRNLVFTGRTNLNDFLVEFDKIVLGITNSGGKMEDSEYISQLLSSMPDEYDAIVTSIDVLLTATPDQVTKDFVRNKLLSESVRIGRKKDEKTESVAPENAFIGQGRGFRKFNRGRGNGKSRGNFRGGHFGRGASRGVDHNRNHGGGEDRASSSQNRTGANRGHNSFEFSGKCYNCQGRGHRRMDCPSYRSANAAHKDSEMEEDDIAFLTTCDKADNRCKQQQSDSDLCFATSESDIHFVIDSGATHHLIKSEFGLYLRNSSETNIRIGVAKLGESIVGKTVGTLPVTSDDGRSVSLKNVYVCDKLSFNLLSVKQMVENGLHVVFDEGHATIMKGDRTVLVGVKRGNLYYVSLKLKSCAMVSATHSEAVLMHRRMGHSSKYPVEGICDTCMKAKQTRATFMRNTPDDRRAKAVLEIVSSDVCGKITPQTHDGKRYYVSFLDHFSNFGMVYLMKDKSEVELYFRKYVGLVENKFGKCVSNLRCDNGGEYTSKSFRAFCEEKGIVTMYSIPRNPENNGKAERYNRTVMEMARCLIFDSGLPKEMWGEAVLTSVYTLNCLTSCAIAEPNITPVEIWSGFKPDLTKIRVFGCTAYAHVPAEDRCGKLAERSVRMVLVGYCNNGYRVWDADRRKVIAARSVVFNEEVRLSSVDVSEDYTVDPGEAAEKTPAAGKGPNNPITSPVSSTPGNKHKIPVPVLRRGERVKKKPSHLDDYVMNMAMCLLVEDESSDIPPSSYEEAISQDERWKTAVETELASHSKNRTWELVPEPPNETVIDSRWVFTRKIVDGAFIMKARLVARGFQLPVMDEEIVYSPVARMLTLRMLLALAVENDLEIAQLDVKSAFLSSTLDEPVYMRPPDGLEMVPPGYVCKLVKSLYGLRQSPKCFNDFVDRKLSDLNFKRSMIDPCLYFDGDIFILIWVDDFLLFSKSASEIEKLKRRLKFFFDLKDFKSKSKITFLGLEIEKKESEIKISQKMLIDKILKHFRMTDCKVQKLPVQPRIVLSRVDGCDKRFPFRELVGSIMYIMLGTRPDLCFAISFFGRFQSGWDETHWNSLKNVLRYLKGTKSLGMVYRKSNSSMINVSAYVDSDFASDPTDRKSISGFLIRMNNNMVCWSSKKQSVVALSSTEAEYVAMANCITECLFVVQLLKEITPNFVFPVLLYEDNQSCIKIAQTLETKRSKHIDVKFHFIRHVIDEGMFKIIYKSTDQQVADVFTKGLSVVKFEHFRSEMNLSPL